MAKNSEIVDQKFFNEFKNGTSFGDNPNDFTRNLTGSVLEKVRVLSTYQISWDIYYLAPDGDPLEFKWGLSYSGNELSIERTDGGDFTTEGFEVGQSATFGIYALLQVEVPCTIVSITKAVIVINTPSITVLPFPPGAIQIRGTEPIQGLVYNFGLIENSDNFSNISLVTEKSMGYYGSGIGEDTGGGRTTAFVDMISLGKFKDFVSGNARARFVREFTFGVVDGEKGTKPRTVQEFEVEHTFIINPWYLDGDLQNLREGILPDYLDGDNSLKYVTNAEWRQVLNNPNIVYPIREEETNGSVGGLNESFNGFEDSYQVDSIDFEEDITGASSDGILVSGRTKITIEISKKSGVLTNGDRFGVYISYLPPESDYQNTEDTKANTLIQNFIYDRALNIAGASFSTGDDFIKELSSTIVAGKMFIECVVEYSNVQQKRLSQRLTENEGNYLIGVQIGDNSRTNGNSDRLILNAQIGVYDESPDIPGLSSISNFQIYPHNEQIGIGQSFTSMISWNEDGLTVLFDLDLDLNKNAFLNSLAFGLVAYNETTEDFFILDSFPIDLSNSPVSNGIQQIEIDTLRNYVLRPDDQNNIVKISTDSNVGGVQKYKCQYGQKIKWQDWIQNLDVNEIFINTSEPNNNQNFKSSNYSLKEGYSIRLAVISNLSGTSDLGVSGITDYLQLSPTVIVYDYGEDSESPDPVWSAEIKTFRLSNMTDLNQAVLAEDTLFRVEWANKNGPVNSLDDLWAINRLERTEDSGDLISELSSLNPFPNNQILRPVFGEPLLKLSLDSGKVIAECVIVGDLVDPSINYNLSCRLHNSTAAVMNFKITSPLGEIKETSGTNESKVTSP